jgi:hypothetical protein
LNCVVSLSVNNVTEICTNKVMIADNKEARGERIRKILINPSQSKLCEALHFLLGLVLTNRNKKMEKTAISPGFSLVFNDLAKKIVDLLGVKKSKNLSSRLILNTLK